MAINNDKLRLLRIMQILMNETDAQHPLSAAKISQILESGFGMHVNRKTIYSDIALLGDTFLKVHRTQSKKGGYYVESRYLELPALKLLVDAVQASKFISVKESEELIRKLSRLASEEEAKRLQRQVFIYNRPKADNEEVYRVVDVVHTAIYENKKIQFQYGAWNIKKEMELMYDGLVFEVSPHALTWENGKYYLVAYNSHKKGIRHYRVEKMLNVCMINSPRDGIEEFRNFDPVAYSKKTFDMYPGARDERVTFYCRNSVVGLFIERFGKDMMLIPVDQEHFRVSAIISVSKQFFVWLSAIGKEVQIQSPVSVRDEYEKYLQELLDVSRNFSSPENQLSET